MKKFLTGALFLAAVSGGFCAEAVSVSIRFYDKQIYYLSDEPVLIQVTITNNGVLPYRFRLADDRAFSLDFDVKTLQNRAVLEAGALLRKRTTSRAVFFRDVSVESGESFSFVEDLQSYADIQSAGNYIVQAKFYPETYLYAAASEVSSNSRLSSNLEISNINNKEADNAAPILFSNRLQLGIRPASIIGEDGTPVALDVETKANLVREKLPPDEVVTWMLTARQKSQWEKFFLYLDLEALLTRDAAQQRQWRAESAEGRARMVVRYRADLMESVADGDISVIPTDFTIERTAYNADNAEVSVIERFRYSNFTERRRYTYYLRRDNGIWNIIDWTVLNLGTE